MVSTADDVVVLTTKLCCKLMKIWHMSSLLRWLYSLNTRGMDIY